MLFICMNHFLQIPDLHSGTFKASDSMKRCAGLVMPDSVRCILQETDPPAGVYMSLMLLKKK